MRKNDLIREVANVTNLTKEESQTVIAIADAVAPGDEVELRGFGSSRVRR